MDESFSMGSGLLRTVAAEAGTSFSGKGMSSVLLLRRRYQKNRPKAMITTMRDPTMAPVRAPVLIPSLCFGLPPVRGTHWNEPQVEQSLE